MPLLQWQSRLHPPGCSGVEAEAQLQAQAGVHHKQSQDGSAQVRVLRGQRENRSSAHAAEQSRVQAAQVQTGHSVLG
jgi:hypothetical protein